MPLSDDLATLKRDLVATLESELKQAAAREAELRAALERLIRDVCAMADDEYDNPTPKQLHDACNRAEAVLREVSK